MRRDSVCYYYICIFMRVWQCIAVPLTLIALQSFLATLLKWCMYSLGIVMLQYSSHAYFFHAAHRKPSKRHLDVGINKIPRRTSKGVLQVGHDRGIHFGQTVGPVYSYNVFGTLSFCRNSVRKQQVPKMTQLHTRYVATLKKNLRFDVVLVSFTFWRWLWRIALGIDVYVAF